VTRPAPEGQSTNGVIRELVDALRLLSAGHAINAAALLNVATTRDLEPLHLTDREWAEVLGWCGWTQRDCRRCRGLLMFVDHGPDPGWWNRRGYRDGRARARYPPLPPEITGSASSGCPLLMLGLTQTALRVLPVLVVAAALALAGCREPDTRNCDDFRWQQDAQAVLDRDSSDPHRLDSEQGPDDGYACERLPDRLVTS
jgi:hypothetical protein